MHPPSHHRQDDSYEIWMMALALKHGDKSYEKQIRHNRRLINAAHEKVKTL